jgi:hypothetical protein
MTFAAIARNICQPFSAALLLAASASAQSVPSLNASNSIVTNLSQSAHSTAGQGTTNAEQVVSTLNVNQAVMVTVELSFPKPLPSIADALRWIERRQQPDDRTGRVFAILDAYGEPTPDGQKVHMSMHVSAEKPGVGALVFRRTGEVLWQSRIVNGPNTNVFTGNGLTILISDSAGISAMVDGSGNPASILDARLRNSKVLIRDFWPDGAEREVTFLYSACGCPVKALVRRTGARTQRVKELPVMFPDDPSAMQVIEQLMGWR